MEEDIVPRDENLVTIDSLDAAADSLNVETDTLDTDSTETVTSLACSDCDFIVTTQLVDGEALGVQPGDVIGLDASLDYGNLKFINIVGTEDQPVIIRNCGGTAVINSTGSYGLKFNNSKHFKLLGNGTGTTGEYGIRVTTTKGFFITMEMFTTNFEIAHVEVAGAELNGIGENNGFAGIGIKTSPYQDCDLFADPSRQAWIMQDVSIHDNYIHDTGGEGLYVGHGFYAGRKEADCSGVTYSHSIKGLRIYNNFLENIGYDGMQIKNADKDVKVYNNVVRNYGTRDHGAHNEGLFIGGGTTGQFYNNVFDTGTGHGLQNQGYGNLDIYNNVFANSKDNGMYSSNGEFIVRGDDAYFNFFNNTIYNSGEIGFVFHNDEGGTKRFKNNLLIKAGTLVKDSAPVEMENNIVTNDPESVGFIDYSHGNFRLIGNSAAVDAGADLSQYGITDDCEGNPRPSGAGFDIGAYEL